MLKKKKVFSGRVFDLEILTKPGMGDLADAIKLQTYTYLFMKYTPILHEPQVRGFYYNVEFKEDGSLTIQIGERRLRLDEKLVGKILGVPLEEIRFMVGKT